LILIDSVRYIDIALIVICVEVAPGLLGSLLGEVLLPGGTMKPMSIILVFIATAISTFCFQNCSKVSFSTDSSDGLNANGLLQPHDDLVCDPLSGSNSCDGGVIGEIYYLTMAEAQSYGNGNSGPNGLHYYYDDGTRAPTTIVLTDIFVPTRSFRSGFPIQNGSLVTTSDGTLFEFFAFKLYTDLKLQAGDSDGDYQFALLADDGANLLNRSSRSVMVNDDGTHRTRFGCSTKTFRMDSNTTIPLEVQFYQGPRDRMALTLMWRKISPGGSLSDTACNDTLEDGTTKIDGNNDFFGPNMDDFSTSYEYGKLLQRGWRPVSAGNFNRVTNL
jgi:hypothetical protein